MKTFENPKIEIITFTTESIMKASGTIDATINNGTPWG